MNCNEEMRALQSKGEHKQNTTTSTKRTPKGPTQTYMNFINENLMPRPLRASKEYIKPNNLTNHLVICKVATWIKRLCPL